MSILICLPCYGGNVSDKTVNGLFNLGKLMVRQNVDHGILTVANESLISKGRSKMANFFINNTDYEYLFFLDSDVGFEAEDVLKLLKHKRDIVSAAYPMKTIPLQWNYALTEPMKRDGDLVAIERIGIGFTIIHRSVFEKIIEKFGEELKYIPTGNSVGHSTTKEEMENSYHFFSEYKKDNIYLPEDLSFFTRAKECGYQPWMDVSVNLCHVGSHIFQE
jgi:hypothetical protein